MKGQINKLTGQTDGKLNATLRSTMRQVWSRTVKQQFIKSVRYKKDGKFHVKCVECGREMWIGAKEVPKNKDGSVSKRKPQRPFDCDHIDGITPLSDPINGLGEYWKSMMTGRLQILCKYPCHYRKTYEK